MSTGMGAVAGVEVTIWGMGPGVEVCVGVGIVAPVGVVGGALYWPIERPDALNHHLQGLR